MMNRQWNVMASLAVLLVLAYAGGYVAALSIGKVDIAAFREGMLPVVTAVLGYVARMIKDQP